MPHVNIALFSRTLCSEIADMFQGGLQELGHTASIQMFTIEPSAVNIIMPAVLFPPEELDRLPPGTVFYNTEDLEYQPPEKQQLLVEIARRGFPLWDYATRNMDWYARNGCRDRARHVPLGYARSIDRVVPLPWEERSIDVLFYGKLTQRRVDVVAALMRTSLTIGIFSHAYGALRDDLMARSKIILNVPAVDAFVAECPRVTFAASNRKLCVAERPAYPLLQSWEEAVTYVPYSEIVATCERLAGDRDAALALEAKAHAAIRSLPIAAGIADGLSALPGRASAA